MNAQGNAYLRLQRQATPPARKRTAMLLQTPEALDRSSRGQSEEQDSVTESPEVLSTKAYQTTAPRSRSKKLGLVGGRGQMNVLTAQQGDISETSRNGVQRSRSSSNTNDHVIEADDQDGHAAHHSLPSTSGSGLGSVEVRHRLGVIGGRGKNTEGDVSDNHAKPATSPASPYRPIEKKGDAEKLNVGATPGTKSNAETLEHQERTSSAPRKQSLSISLSSISSAPKTHIIPSLENSQERADRKRAELRKVLEEKAKAPTQKRRRF